MSSRRIGRVCRLKDLEQKKLDAMVMDLAEINSQLAARHEVQDGFEQSLKEMFDTHRQDTDPVTVDSLQQAGAWSASVESSIAYAKEQVKQATEVRDQMISMIADQKRAVDGLEKLITKLNEQVETENGRIEIKNADDSFLQTTMRSEA